MKQDMQFSVGERVRQIFRARAVIKERLGTIVGRAQFRGDWLVKWDNDPCPKPRVHPMYERDLAPEIDPHAELPAGPT
jgi:hypothetical protein